MLFVHTQMCVVQTQREVWRMFQCTIACTLKRQALCATSDRCCLSATQHRNASKRLKTKKTAKRTKDGIRKAENWPDDHNGAGTFLLIFKCGQRIAAPTTGSAAKRNVCRVMEN
ncbi:hypothetical protein TRVL_08908 [Trypanosoma vivax]|nr:hypothetical protein TRVL_08908 [Trypanosoma vivax]